MNYLRTINQYKFSLIILMGLMLNTSCNVQKEDKKAELIKHTVAADGHPMALWEKSSSAASEAILLVHGRTLERNT